MSDSATGECAFPTAEGVGDLAADTAWDAAAEAPDLPAAAAVQVLHHHAAACEPAADASAELTCILPSASPEDCCCT